MLLIVIKSNKFMEVYDKILH